MAPKNFDKTLVFEVVDHGDAESIVAEVRVTITPSGGKAPRRGLVIKDMVREIKERLHDQIMEAAGSTPDKYGDWTIEFVKEVKS